MGRARRHRRKYTWLPQLGFQSGDPNLDTVVLPVSFGATLTDGAPGIVAIIPIVPDAPRETPGALTDQLVDFVGNEWFLKRIVGKLHLTTSRINVTTGNSGNELPLDICIGAGFFVARAGEDNINPIGAQTVAAANNSQYGPLNLATTREPWIWRRTWCLSPQILAAGVASETLGGFFPHNNYCGSVAEGSHIDAKTARRIGQDDRLYFAIQAMATQIGGGATTVAVSLPDAQLDVRILGALRRAKQRSAF